MNKLSIKIVANGENTFNDGKLNNKIKRSLFIENLNFINLFADDQTFDPVKSRFQLFSDFINST